MRNAKQITAKQMERRLTELSEAWTKRRDKAARREYQELHPRWLEQRAKEEGGKR